jgi:hypothetical protein
MGVLIAFGVLVLIIVIIVKIFAGGGSSNAKKIDLTSYAHTDAVVQLKIEGPEVYYKDHREIKITVGRSQNELQIQQGYQGHVLSDKTFNNNEAAYAVFLHALDHAGFTDFKHNPKNKDERGYCPEDERYIFELVSGSKDVERAWTAGCSDVGTFKGNTSLIEELFEQQIPKFNDLTQNINFAY